MILLVLLLLASAVTGQQLPCGSTPITQSRVIGGQDAKPGAWPWQIALKRYGRFICGGSLISADWIVTAAHCVSGSSNAANYKIVVGDHNRNTNEGTEEEVGAIKIISHPQYNSPRLSSDIALIQLDKPVTLSQRVNPICIPSHDSDVPTGSKCYITGWGKIKHPGSSYHILQQAMMPPIDNTKCNQKIQASGVSISLTPQMLCAGVENTILSGCHGDSGGPYVCLNSDKKTYTLHGAVSWGSGSCNAKQLFTVFARVTKFRAWIKQHTGVGGGGGSPPPPPSPPVPTTPGNNVFECFFDTGLCGFVQSLNDKFDWTLRSGATPSYQTGPTTDVSKSGKYAYIEVTGKSPGDNAKLVKGGLSFSTKKCLSFYYHMYGATMGTLNVLVGQKNVFTLSGDQGNQWKQAKVEITEPGASELIFEGIRGSSYTGDVAIDNVVLKECGGGGGGGGGGCGSTVAPPATTAAPTPQAPSTAAPPVAFGCNFDSSLCGFVQDTNDKFDWTRLKGSTGSSSTGPSADHTTGSGYYMYIETSSPRQQGDNAKLHSPKLQFSGNMCLQFFYHMYGSNMGEFKVEINGVNVFSKSGDQSNIWHEVKKDVNLSGMYTITFEGIRGNGFRSDIAIDDFLLTPGSCSSSSTVAPPATTAAPTPPAPSTAAPPVAVVCNFDSSLCGFVQDTNDKFDWTQRKGSTPSSYTGPSADHTTGYGYYMYIETSSPRQQGDNAKLHSPKLQFSGNMCLQFFYHMYGSDMGEFKVEVNGVNVFSKSGDQNNTWHEVKKDLNLSGMYTITFEGIRGSSYRGDIAIDDFVLAPGSCSSITPPPPTTPGSPPPQGSCGIRPASRIVGGVDAKYGDWPWQVQLRTTSDFPYCGGSLVSDKWVVTATHCVRGKPPTSIIIRAGAHHRITTDGNVQDLKVIKVITHPSYHKPTTYSHDIALLKLEKQAQLNRYVNLVCLPHSVPAPTDGTKCWITGWGRLASGGATPNILQQVQVPVVSRARCDKAYPNKIHDSMICAGLDQGGIDSCQGDSGGPMVCETGGKYYLHGATSWGYGCASPGKFGVYAKVKYLLTWINSEMSKN